MKKTTLKILSLGLCTALCTGVIGHAEYKEKTGENSSANTVLAAEADKSLIGSDRVSEWLSDLIADGEGNENESPVFKDEMVYVLAGADGTAKKIIVSDWLKNSEYADVIYDASGLSEIENVKGYEEFAQNGFSTVWNAEGKDIYYNGVSSNRLPVDIKVTYTLDGREVSPAEIAGKSGHAVIRFDYHNNEYEMVDINGSEEKIYVPYAMATGMMLDTDCFRNIEVTNGKLINDGNHTVIAGIALPGLKENLGAAAENIDIPDYIEISADVSDFKLGMTVTVAANEIWNKIDETKLEAGDFAGAADDLKDAVDLLTDGSRQLADGLNTLLEKTGELANGVKLLADGAVSLSEGADKLDEGAAALASGMNDLYNGLSTLTSNNDTLNDGAKQVFESLLSTANTQLAANGLEVPKLTISNYGEVLDGVIASLDSDSVYAQALAQVTAAVEANRELITSKVIEGVKAQVAEQVKAAVKAGVEEKVEAAVKAGVAQQVEAAVKAGVAEKVNALMAGADKAVIDATVAAQMESDEVKATIAAKLDEQMASDAVKAMIEANLNEQMESEAVKALVEANIAEQMASEKVKAAVEENVEAQAAKLIAENMESEEVQTKLGAASEGAKSIIGLKTSLDSYNAFYKGLKAYTNGVTSAAEGAAKLKSGASQLAEGASQLAEGADTLEAGLDTLNGKMPELKDGVTQLAEGSQELADGIQKFYYEGVSKILSVFDEDLAGVADRIKAMVSVSKSYNNYSGIADDMDGQVKFIYRTEAIE